MEKIQRGSSALRAALMSCRPRPWSTATCHCREIAARTGMGGAVCLDDGQVDVLQGPLQWELGLEIAASILDSLAMASPDASGPPSRAPASTS